MVPACGTHHRREEVGELCIMLRKSRCSHAWRGPFSGGVGAEKGDSTGCLWWFEVPNSACRWKPDIERMYTLASADQISVMPFLPAVAAAANGPQARPLPGGPQLQRAAPGGVNHQVQHLPPPSTCTPPLHRFPTVPFVVQRSASRR